MKRWLVIIILLLPLAASAVDEAPFNVSGNLVRFGNSITISDNVSGDVIIGGSDVTVSGHVGGDVLAVGNRIRVTGTVDGNVRAAGSDVILTGEVQKNVTIAAASFTLDSASVVHGTVAFASSQAALAGKADHAVDGWVSQATVSGTVGGDLTLRAGNGNPAVTLTKSAQVDGAFHYTANNQAAVADGATVKGERTFTQTQSKKVNPFFRRFRLFQEAVAFFGAVLVGLLLLGLARRFTADVIESMGRRSGRTVLAGIFVLIGVPIIALFLVLTLIGAPLAILLILAYVMALIVGSSLVGLRIGSWLSAWLGKRGLKFAQNISPTWQLVAGVFVTLLVVDVIFGGWWAERVAILGTIGTLLHFFIAVWALGAVTLVLWSRARQNQE